MGRCRADAPKSSPAGYIQWLADRGVTLSVAKGHLLAKSSRPLDQETRILLSRAEPLLVGHLSGQPVPCAVCDAAATSIGFPSAPLCGQHLGEAS